MTPTGANAPRMLLSLPRCGTHFFWAHLVASGQYQLIYDADRIPALKVLSEHCGEKLDFLWPPPKNPNYNFQYNSLQETERPMTAAEHVQWLMEKYSASSDRDLFMKIMRLQDMGGRRLFSINRFCYTISYEWLFTHISYSVDHALEALGVLCDWMREYDPNTSVVLIVRDVPAWIDSLFMLWGAKRRPRITRCVREMPRVLDWSERNQIPVFWMRDAIRAVNEGHLDFEERIRPFTTEDFSQIARSAASCLEKLSTWPCPRNAIRLRRMFTYLRQRDPILRTSWVRSIGILPLGMAKYLPFIGRRIKKDIDGLVLNNARIRPLPGPAANG